MSGFRQGAGSGHTAVMTSAAGDRGMSVATAPPPVATVGAAAAELREARSALWLDDLRWHKQMFRQSRFQWTGEHAVDIITRHTGGQVEFTDVRHLRRLQHEQNEIADYTGQCRTAMGEPLREAARTVIGGWNAVAEAVGLDAGHLKAIEDLSVGATAEQRSNPDVRRVLRQLPFTNPLIQVWELKQLVNLFQAAVDLVEDTLCDLLLELSSSHPSAVLMAATTPQFQALTPARRVEWARKDRGGPGDPRRTPRQRF